LPVRLQTSRPAHGQSGLIADDVVRFAPPGTTLDQLPPFPAYVSQPRLVGPTPSPWLARPRFTRKNGKAHVEVAFEAGTSFYGTGEVAGSLLRNGSRKLLYNNDCFDYTEASKALYQSHPFVLAVRKDGSSVGVIFESTWRSVIELGRIIRFTTAGPAPTVTIIERKTPADVLAALTHFTGRIPMPPRWALGYHQCRWSYEPADRVRQLARTFREKRIPCDCIWMDIDYMEGFRCFTVDRKQFGDPAALNADLHALGFHSVWMIDPGLKVDEWYSVYAAAKEGDHLIKTVDGLEYHGKVWPGECAFPDFTRERTRRWWAGLYADFLASGIDGVWNDMNEPAVFEAPEKTMPTDNRHEADDSLGGPGPHTQYHNIYGMQMVRATREGIQAARPDKRPFVLTRANFLGGHRYAATWTGDNRSDWNHLRWSIPMALNLGLSGQAFSGPDIGGFIGNATPDLFARFMGIGSLLPFARAHSVKDSTDHEPWSFGPDCEDACRIALERRYRLLPYLYTLFAEAAETGMPVVRPLFFADPADPRLRSEDRAFLLGPDILVRADVEPTGGGSHSAMPPGRWQRFELTDRTSPHLPELWIRAGAAVPVGPVMQFISDRPASPLTLIVCLDENGHARGDLYEDDGDGFGYAKGEFCKVRFSAQARTAQSLTSTAADADDVKVTMDHVAGSTPFAAREIGLEWIR